MFRGAVFFRTRCIYVLSKVFHLLHILVFSVRTIIDSINLQRRPSDLIGYRISTSNHVQLSDSAINTDDKNSADLVTLFVHKPTGDFVCVT